MPFQAGSSLVPFHICICHHHSFHEPYSGGSDSREKGDLSCMATYTPHSVTGHFVTPSAGARCFTKLCLQRFPSRICCLSAVDYQLPAVLFLWSEFQGPGNGGDKHLSNS